MIKTVLTSLNSKAADASWALGTVGAWLLGNYQIWLAIVVGLGGLATQIYFKMREDSRREEKHDADMESRDHNAGK